MGTYLTWLADELRAAGLTVVEHDGWRTRGAAGYTYPNGGFRVTNPAVIWHHDASAVGDSPGVPDYMLRYWATAAAQLWVSRAGVWHVLAAGVAWQTGAVLTGMPGNWTSIGIETDHTTGEDWPPALLDSLRRGTAAMLRRLGHDATALHMHKTICSPVGRKTDPDGLDLTTERTLMTARITGDTDTMTPAEIAATASATATAVWARIITRSGYPNGLPVIQDLADARTATIQILDALTKLPDKVAAAVVDAITARYDVALTLAPKETAAP